MSLGTCACKTDNVDARGRCVECGKLFVSNTPTPEYKKPEAFCASYGCFEKAAAPSRFCATHFQLAKQNQAKRRADREPLLARIAGVAGEVSAECEWAMVDWPPFNSAHEGYAVLLEEVEELWAHVKTNQKRRNLKEMRKEAIQVAAMAIRFAIEVCDEQRGRK